MATATKDGLYECTGIGETKFFAAGEHMEPGGCQECQEGTAIWLLTPADALDRQELVEASIDLDSLTRGVYIEIDDLFSEGDVVNLKIQTDQELADLANGAYRILGGKEDDGDFHFWAEKIGHNYWDPEAPLYHASPHPR